MAYIETRNITSTSFEARVCDLLVAGSIGHYVIWYFDGSPNSDEDLADDATETSWILFDNLEPETPYVVSVENINGYGIIMDEKTLVVTTLSDSSGGGGDDGGDDGDDTEDTWYVSGIYSWGKLDSLKSKSISIPKYGAARIDFSFSTSGTATFYSSGASSAYATLSTSREFDERYGDALYILSEGGGRSGDFSFTYEVEAGLTYYLFVNHYSKNASGNINVCILPPHADNGRPDLFEWDTKKESGKPFNLTASEWVNLLNNINKVREYLGLSVFKQTIDPDELMYFYYPEPGDAVLAAIYNQVIYAFDNMKLLDYDEYCVTPQTPITADRLKLLKETINSVE